MKRLILKYIGIFFLLIASFFAFSVLACWWPDKNVKLKINHMAVTFSETELYPQMAIDRTACQQDNFTETLILNQIFCIKRHKPVRSAMGVYRGHSEPWYDLPGALLKTTKYDPEVVYAPYPRYWHGNTFLFRILLSFMNYGNLQWLMFAVSTLLLVCFVCCYYPRAGIWKTIAFVLSWALVYGFMMQFSIQYFTPLAIALTTSILIVRHEHDMPYIALLFFITACLTNYFDLFTIPMLTFGWPLIAWLSLQDDRDIQFKSTSLSILKWGTLWVTGYGLTFISKWVLASIFLKENILKDGFGQVFYRMNGDDFSRWDAITQNISLIPWSFVAFALLVFIIASILHFQGHGGKKAIFFLLIALLPYAWYFFTANHSYLHYWFTYRLQAITLSAIFMAILSFSADRPRR